MRRLKEQINAQPLAEDQPVRVKAKLPAPKLRKISIKPIAPKLPIAAPEDDSDSE
jgi:hypothetical protein